jgi:hypothetical protein
MQRAGSSSTRTSIGSWFLGRELYFQALDRFYPAFQGFLLALQFSRRTYPIAYNRWIREQVADNLGLPDLY